MLCCVLVLCWFVVLVPAVPDGYSVLDPNADHTAAAIEYDGLGDHPNMIRSFLAAVRFVPTFRNHHNIGVAFMRMGHAAISDVSRVVLPIVKGLGHLE